MGSLEQRFRVSGSSVGSARYKRLSRYFIVSYGSFYISGIEVDIKSRDAGFEDGYFSGVVYRKLKICSSIISYGSFYISGVESGGKDYLEEGSQDDGKFQFESSAWFTVVVCFLFFLVGFRYWFCRFDVWRVVRGGVEKGCVVGFLVIGQSCCCVWTQFFQLWFFVITGRGCGF